VDSVQIHQVGNEWILLRTTRHKRGSLVSWIADTSGETSMGACKLEEGIEKPYSDILAHTPELCKSIPSNQ
jgi:hypothetical protein